MVVKKRMDWIDIAKGIGILLMIFGHCDYVGSVQRWIYSFHMPLFFVLSGLLYAYKNEQTLKCKDMLMRKARGLIIPYFLFSLAYIGYMVVFLLLNNSFAWAHIKAAVIHTLMFVGEGNLWFIPCLFFSTLMFHVLKTNKARILISIIAFVIIVHYFPNGNSQYSMITLMLKICIGMFFIYVGTMFAEAIRTFNQKSSKELVGILILLVIINLLTYYWNGTTPVDLNTIRVNNVFLYIVATISGVAACIIVSIMLKTCPILEYFGRNSIWFLVLNNLGVIITVIRVVLLNYFETMNYPFIITFWICVVLYEVIFFELIQKIIKGV